MFERTATAPQASIARPHRPVRSQYVSPSAAEAAATRISTETLYTLAKLGILNTEQVGKVFDDAMSHCSNLLGGEGVLIGHLKSELMWDLRYRDPEPAVSAPAKPEASD